MMRPADCCHCCIGPTNKHVQERQARRLPTHPPAPHVGSWQGEAGGVCQGQGLGLGQELELTHDHAHPQHTCSIHKHVTG
jgi:hypothetical protein